MRRSTKLLRIGLTTAITVGCDTLPPGLTTIDDNVAPYTATLTPDQVVGGALAGPTGTGAFSLNADQTQLAYELTVTGLSGAIIGAYVREGTPGSNGPPVTSLTIMFDGEEARGTWDVTPDLVASLDAGLLYIDIQTEGQPNGALRGQIQPTP